VGEIDSIHLYCASFHILYASAQWNCGIPWRKEFLAACNDASMFCSQVLMTLSALPDIWDGDVSTAYVSGRYSFNSLCRLGLVPNCVSSPT
jgi:hypothetical protein